MSTAVLFSGGLDSAVLLADEASRAGSDVHPIYVLTGMAWEAGERARVEQLLADRTLSGRVRSLVAVSTDMRDVYAATHWAVAGTPPAFDTPDEDVYLPGRNIILLGKAAVYCAATRIERIVLGTLAHNPFPDATPQFRNALAHALSLGLAAPLRIDAPFAGMSKADVIRRGAELQVPFELTLSCMNPTAAFTHCGRCSKCRERHDAFLDARMADPTEYADLTFVAARNGAPQPPRGV